MERIYLDHNATTPVRPEAAAAMTAYLSQHFGNASSMHAEGQAARRALEDAREKMASFIGAEDPSEVIFTSGGTESNNMALKGSLVAGGNNRIVTSAIEHSSARLPIGALVSSGRATSTAVKVGSDGIVNVADVEAAITPDTALVSIMTANNEIGTIQPADQIGALCRKKGVPFHSDAVQIAGKSKINVNTIGCDLLTLSGHKFGAPKGVGLLYVRKGTRLSALIHGGHQEKNRRGGTENVAGIVAMATAAECDTEEMEAESVRLGRLRDLFESLVLAKTPLTTVNGNRTLRTCNTSNLCFEYTDNSALLMALDMQGIACSSGSACAAGNPEPSHVLLALGLTQDRAHASLRFSLGHNNTEEQIRMAAAAITQSVARLRETHPMWKEASGS